LRARRVIARAKPRASHSSVEKEADFGFANIARQSEMPKTNVQTRTYRQTPVCFNLAVRRSGV